MRKLHLSGRLHNEEYLTSPQFKLEVWTPCHWEKIYFDLERKRPAESTNFQECLYSWKLNIDPKMGLNENETVKFNQLTLEKFDPQKPVEERDVQRLKEPIEYMDKLSEKYPQKFMPCSPVFINEIQKDRYIHTLWALSNQLKWVYETFKATPNTSVTFR